MMVPVEDLSTIFSDLTPLPQNDGGPDGEAVCVIQYPTSFRLAYDYMRAVWDIDELSDRSLKLTALCLKMNPANYTVWHFRRKCLRSLMMVEDTAGGGEGGGQTITTATTRTATNIRDVIAKDLDLSQTLGGSNPKNYQIWYHRRVLLQDFYPRNSLKGDFLHSELDYITSVLDEDSKNYHAWSHRQWLISTINENGVWEKEMDFSNSPLR